MKFAYLVMTELRAIEKTIQNLYEYIIDPYEADIFLCVQKTFSDDDKKIELFNKNVTYKEVYEKPEPHKYFGLKNKLNSNTLGNWCMPSNLQIYINYNKMSQVIENIIDNYDYFITFRTDVCLLFPLPEKSFFENIPKAIYSFDASYAKNWGGCGFSVFIHKNFIINYLKCYYNVISNETYKNYKISPSTNQENFQSICLKIAGLPNRKYIKNINFYYTAITTNDYTTWSKPVIHPKYNVVCKYDKQCDEAYQNYKLWMNKCKWKYYNDCIFLELSPIVIQYRNYLKNITKNKKIIYQL